MLERIAELVRAPEAAGGLGAWGDDAVVLARPAGQLLLCTDAGVAGVHLDVDCFPIGDLGYRTAVAALSDLAAMGGRPLGVVVSICAPGDVDVVEIEREVVAACDASATRVLGGDLSRSEVTTVVVAALGEAQGPTVTRRGASAGEHLFVTGPLGAAAAGLRRRREGVGLDDDVVMAHRRPAARLAEGAAAAASGATAMIDVSDGLGRDVRRLTVASRVGVALVDVPCAAGATPAEALGGGEDYELLVAHPSRAALLEAFRAAGLRTPIEIGRLVDDAAVLTLDGEPLADVGWRH